MQGAAVLRTLVVTTRDPLIHTVQGRRQVRAPSSLAKRGFQICSAHHNNAPAQTGAERRACSPCRGLFIKGTISTEWLGCRCTTSNDKHGRGSNEKWIRMLIHITKKSGKEHAKISKTSLTVVMQYVLQSAAHMHYGQGRDILALPTSKQICT